jgi:mono/diheme cytochrome c family protein
MRKIIWVVFTLLVVAVAGGYLYATNSPDLHVSVPPYEPAGERINIDQTWTDAQRVAFHHTSQGTRLVPYAWFKALEQPCLSLLTCEAFAKPEYLGRFGFIPSPVDPKWNPDGFPIGFAVQQDFHDPITKTTYPAVGLTCAACHTGELRYGKYSVVIEGAPAPIEVTEFQKALGLALIFTKYVPLRYGRFERAILGPNATDAQKSELKQSFDAFLAAATKEVSATRERKTYPYGAGFNRTDALTRIGNQVFAVDMDNFNNLAAANAPVRFPQIWDASWFTWVQYNSSISDPMVRNIGEALGVRALAKLYGSDATEFSNSVHVEGLRALEELLAGAAPFEGLRSPRWPGVFPGLDAAKVAQGEALYRQHCAGCHLPPPNDLVADLASSAPKHWWKNSQGKSYLVVTDIPVEEIGTDEHEAADFIERKADTGALGKGRVSADAGLRLVTIAIRDNYYTKMGLSPADRIAWSGFRDPADETVRAPRVYKARPLNGIWAVGSYLHNGSVPNLYLLLSPASERPAKFWTGSKTFDPIRVGRENVQLSGGYEFDTSLPGNKNTGHEFNDRPKGNGIIGPKLSEADRWALVEYLKSI